MNEEVIGETIENIRNTGKRALAFDTFILRRAWGIYYSVWALSISLFVFLPFVIPYILPEDVQVFAYPVIYSLVNFLAALFTVRTF